MGQEDGVSRYPVHLCDFRTPPGEKECLEAVFSTGRACRKCYREDCYRMGWRKDAVDSDNRRRCREQEIELYGQAREK